jgi:hypothetical protein
MTIEKRCPGCGQVHPARVTRQDRDATEWECSFCRYRWNIRGNDGTPYSFMERDCDRILQNDEKPYQVPWK